MNEEILIWLTSSGGLLAIVTAILKHFEGKKIKKENKKLIDDAQNEDIKKLTAGMHEIKETVNDLSNSVNEFSSDIKDNKFIKQLSSTTLMAMHRILKSKKCKNLELKKSIFKGQSQFVKFAESILYQEFDVTDDIIFDTGYNFLADVSTKLKLSSLNILKPEHFFCQQKGFLIIQLENFIFDFQQYKNKKNGDRRKDFNKSLVKMFVKITQNTIDLFSKFEQVS